METVLIKTGSICPGSCRFSISISRQSSISARISIKPEGSHRPALSESLSLERSGFDRLVPVEDLGFSSGGRRFGGAGGGSNGGDGCDGIHGGGGNRDRREMGEYYEEMLKLNPGDSLLLRNYAKYLHEVECDVEKAEEYYSRAILASPGDGEVLSLYANLIWEMEKDEDRARLYFDQAVHASPDDCMVLGSYAHFMWEMEENEEKFITVHNRCQQWGWHTRTDSGDCFGFEF